MLILEGLQEGRDDRPGQVIALRVLAKIPVEPEGHRDRPNDVGDQLLRRPDHPVAIGLLADRDAIGEVILELAQAAVFGVFVERQRMPALEIVGGSRTMEEPGPLLRFGAIEAGFLKIRQDRS